MGRLGIFLEGFRKGMKNFSSLIAGIVNSGLLLIVYVFGVGLTSIFARLARKNFLDTELYDDKKSYWSKLDLKKKPIEDYFRQF